MPEANLAAAIRRGLTGAVQLYLFSIGVGQFRKKREQLRVHGLLLLAYRLLRWPKIVTSRLPSSPLLHVSAQADPAPSLLTFFFGVLLAMQQRKSSSSHLGVRAHPKILPRLPPPPLPPQDFRQKNTSEKRIVLTKNARAKKQGFRSKKSTKQKGIKSMSLMTGQRLATIARYLLREIKRTSYLTTYAESFDTKSAIAEEVFSDAMKVDGSTSTQSLTTEITTYSHLRL